MARGPQFTVQLSSLVPQGAQDQIDTLERGRPEGKSDIIRQALEVGLAKMESPEMVMIMTPATSRLTGQISVLITVPMNGRIEALAANIPGGKSWVVRQALKLGLPSVKRRYALADKA